MLPHEPETIAEMKTRLHKAIEKPVNVFTAMEDRTTSLSSDRNHVFDFHDGMRMIVSVDHVIDTDFFHVSASGNDAYAASIKGEGIHGLLEDVLLRVAALLGRKPGSLPMARYTNGILHVVFAKESENEQSV